MNTVPLQSNLQEDLKVLYQRVSTLWWRKRLCFCQSSSQEFDSSTLRQQLGHYIDDLLQQTGEAMMSPLPVKHLHPAGSASTVPGSDAAVGSPPADHALGNYFRQHHRTYEADDVVSRLQHTVWEHIHAAFRWARCGDPEKAQLHAHLVESALQELAQFVDDESYKAFVMEIGQFTDQALPV